MMHPGSGAPTEDEPPRATTSGSGTPPSGETAASPDASGAQESRPRTIEGAGLYWLLVESVRDYAIFMLDPTGHVMSWNQGAQRIKRYRAEEIIGKHFSIFYGQEDLDAGKPAYELKEAAAVGRFEDEGWRFRSDGTRFWANVIITALRDYSGTLVGFAKVTRDLTERKRSEEQAIEQARLLAASEAANRAKSEFLATLSHELRTPLNAIGGYTELMEIGVGGPLTQRQLEFLSRIRESQQHLHGLIRDLLDYSRIEAGEVKFEQRPIELHALVNRGVAMVAPQAAMKRIEVVHGPCAELVSALGDELKVDQILINLLSNAVKFTPEGGTVRLSCDGDADHARLAVQDSGPGISVENQAAIFEPFVQIGRTLANPQEGAGLGLAISRDLARGMGGDLLVESERGKGTTFTLSLPAR